MFLQSPARVIGEKKKEETTIITNGSGHEAALFTGKKPDHNLALCLSGPCRGHQRGW